jgi:hypothetical protein
MQRSGQRFQWLGRRLVDLRFSLADPLIQPIVFANHPVIINGYANAFPMFCCALLRANLLTDLLIESRAGGLGYVRDVGVAGSNPVTPTIEEIFCNFARGAT